MEQTVLVERPDGAVVTSSLRAFDVCHRPYGAKILGPIVGTAIFGADGSQGGWRWRSHWPAQRLRLEGWYTTTVLDHTPHIAPGAVALLHRPMASDLPDMVEGLHKQGARVLVNLDDEIHAIPKQNMSQPTRSILAGLERGIATADGLVVATPRLAEVYGPMARQTWVCPNRAPVWLQEVEPEEPDDRRIRVGWMGSLASHRQDLEWLAPAAKDVFEGATFSTVGDVNVPTFLGLEGPSECWAWDRDTDPTRMYQRMGRAQIGLVPLDNDRYRDFNTSKSWIKALEYANLGIPVVATDLPEQRRLLGGSGAGLLVKTPQEMAEAVQTLIHDGPKRKRMAAAARRLARKHAIERHNDWSAPLEAMCS